MKRGDRKDFREWEILEITSLDRKDEFTKDDSPAEFSVIDSVSIIRVFYLQGTHRPQSSARTRHRNQIQ